MTNIDEKKRIGYVVGLCPRLIEDFGKMIFEHGFEIIDLNNYSDYKSLPKEPDAVAIDLAGEGSLGLNNRVSEGLPEIPRVLISAESDDFSDDHDAFALLHRPITAIELLDILLWACDFKKDIEKDPSRKYLLKRPRIDVFLEEAAMDLLPNAQWLSAIFDHLPIGLILINPQGQVVRANNSILVEFGFDRINPGDKCDEIVPWKDIEGIGCQVDKCLKQNEVLRDLFEIPGGEFVEAIHVPVISEGHTTGVLMLLEKVPMEASFTSRLMNISDVIDEGIAIIDREMRYVWVNDVMRKTFGLEEGYQGQSCFSIMNEEMELCDNCHVQSVFQDGQIRSSYIRARTAQGERKTFEVIAGPIRNRRGEIIRAVKILRDVTGRESVIDKLAMTKSKLEDANAELSRRLNELRMLTELSVALQTVEKLENNLNIFLTAATAKQGCGFNRAFLFLVNNGNNSLEGMMGIGPETPEDAGRIWTELEQHSATFADILEEYGKKEIQETKFDRIIQQMSYSLNDKSSILVNTLFSKRELIVRDKHDVQGAEELAEKLDTDSFAIVPLLAMGKPVGVVVVDNQVSGHLIEERKVQLLKTIASHASLSIERSQLLDQLKERNEQLRETYQKLQENQDILIRNERLSTIGKLAAQVAHEIRNPLVSIGGFARNIAKRAEPDSPIRNYSDIIREETKRLEEILEDVLSYSRQAEPKLRPYDINKLMERTIELLNDQIEGNKIDVEMALEDDVGEISIDPDQIRQVMMNLIKNAINAMPNGGLLRVTTHKAGGFVWIDILDSGTGIPEEYRDKIFEPFFTTKSSGTGLGLPISYQIIDAHGGMIWFTSTPEKGTTFHVKLPART